MQARYTVAVIGQTVRPSSWYEVVENIPIPLFILFGCVECLSLVSWDIKHGMCLCLAQRLEMARRVGNRRTECCALCNLGNCFRASGKLQEAMEYYLLVSLLCHDVS